MRRRSLLRLAFAAAAAIAAATSLGSCLSPTLPLPPPDVNRVFQNADGVWTVSGTCIQGAIVTILDSATGKGVVVEDRGKTGIYVVDIAASGGDQGVATQTVGGELSSEGTFTFVASSSGTGGGRGSSSTGGTSSGH